MFWLVFLRVFQSCNKPILTSFSRLIFQIAFLAYFWEEMFMTIKNQLNYHKGDKEIYTLLHGRSSLLTNYDQFLLENSDHPDLDANFSGLSDIQSIFIKSKYDSPVHTWAHT